MTVVLFLLAILGANLAVTYLEPVTVWPGIAAPAGVYAVAAALVLRDLVQRRWGAPGLAVAFIGGVALSYALADPAVTTASVAAFAVSFVIDTLVFTALRSRCQLWVCVLVSGLISLVPDTLVFLGMAGLLEFTTGQLIGKTYGTVIAAAIVYMMDEDRDRV